MTSLAQLQATLSAWLREPEVLRLVFVALVTAGAFALALALSFLVLGILDPLRRRVGAVRGEGLEAPGGPRASRVLEQIGGALETKDESKRGHVAESLLHAGYRSPNAVRLFFALRFLGVAAMPALVLGWWLTTGSVNASIAMAMAIGAAAIAYVMPDLWVARKARRRKDRLRKALPDALDLMVVCTEAGLGLNAAIQRVADEIEIQHPDMSDELHLVMMQTRAGMDNRTALKELEVRTGVEDIRAFVTTLVQSMRFGTSIADSLRVFSEEMRDKRLQRVQEAAAKLSVKMLGPIGLFIFPSFLLVAVGPAMMTLLKAFRQLGGG